MPKPDNINHSSDSSHKESFFYLKVFSAHFFCNGNLRFLPLFTFVYFHFKLLGMLPFSMSFLPLTI